MQLTSPLVALIISQCADQTVHQAQVRQLKQAIRQGNREQQCLNNNNKNNNELYNAEAALKVQWVEMPMAMNTRIHTN